MKNYRAVLSFIAVAALAAGLAYVLKIQPAPASTALEFHPMHNRPATLE